MINDRKPIEDLDPSWVPLVKLARQARKKAYAPYSKFLVGCALQDATGKSHTGCNVENASYSAAICAERSALVKMVSRGCREARRVVVVTSSEDPVFPCGVCLQVLQELAPHSQVIAVNRRGTLFRQTDLHALIPSGF